jgi:hypothetical protein
VTRPHPRPDPAAVRLAAAGDGSPLATRAEKIGCLVAVRPGLPAAGLPRSGLGGSAQRRMHLDRIGNPPAHAVPGRWLQVLPGGGR